MLFIPAENSSSIMEGESDSAGSKAVIPGYSNLQAFLQVIILYFVVVVLIEFDFLIYYLFSECISLCG